MRQHSKEAWDVASKFADALASETRDLAACIDVALAAERERCVKIVRDRAAKWNEHAKAGHPGDCAESLADECEDILAAILKSE